MNNKHFFKNLDALRFISFLVVFLFHSFHSQNQAILDNPLYSFVKRDLFGNGNLGVNFFFVLSGFLITYLLIIEKKNQGKIKLLNFWMRRVLKIWPLFFFCIFFGFTIFPQIKLFFGESSNETANPYYYITFLNNFDFLNKGLPDASILGVLWSVAIEEQFYLVWPIILIAFSVKRYWIPFSLIILTSLVFRAYYNNLMINEHHTISCISDMVVGAFGAWCILNFNWFKEKIESLNKSAIFLVYTSVLIIFFFRDELLLSNQYLMIFERLIISIIFLLVILEQNYSVNSFFKLGNLRLFSNLGKVTYGLYCLHFIGILVALKLTGLIGLNSNIWQVIFIEAPLSLLISILIAKISYRFFELPFLKLKKLFQTT